MFILLNNDRASDCHCVWIPAGVQVDCPKGVELSHVFLAQLEVEDLQVLVYPVFLPRLGQDDEAVLQAPTQADLSRCLVVLFGQGSDDLVLHKLVIVSGEGRIGLDGDVVLSAELDGLGLPQERMDLKLVDRWLYLRKFQQIFEVFLEEVANPDVPHLSFLLQLSQSSPCFVPAFFVFGAVDVVLGHSRPVDDQQIQVSNFQPLQDALAGYSGFFVALLSRRYLARNEYLAAVEIRLLQHLPDHFLILVDRCSIDVSVACLQRPAYSFVAFLSSQLVSPVSDARNLMSRLQLLLIIYLTTFHAYKQLCCSSSSKTVTLATCSSCEAQREG